MGLMFESKEDLLEWRARLEKLNERPEQYLEPAQALQAVASIYRMVSQDVRDHVDDPTRAGARKMMTVLAQIRG